MFAAVRIATRAHRILAEIAKPEELFSFLCVGVSLIQVGMDPSDASLLISSFKVKGLQLY
jgi:hypothetical protein